MAIESDGQTNILDDARIMLRYALESEAVIDGKVIDPIDRQIGLSPDPAPSPGNDDDVALPFLEAFDKLAEAIAPVTAESLRNTDDTLGPAFLGLFSKISASRIWARKLWIWTIFAIFFIIFTHSFRLILLDFFPADHEPTSGSDPVLLMHGILGVLLIILPFVYGLLGSCVFLLKSCHKHIVARTFDIRRVPEYYSRMLLGVVAGGTILLLVSQLTDDEGNSVELAEGALAFLAGYNTDLLFQAADRIIQAIIPRIGLDSVQRRQQTPLKTSTIDIESLMTLADKSTNKETREAILELIKSMKPKG